MIFFGGWECDASFGRPQQPTPVGVECGGCCERRIGPGDAGVAIPNVVFSDEDLEVRAFGDRDFRTTYSYRQVDITFTVFHGDCFLHHLGWLPCPASNKEHP